MGTCVYEVAKRGRPDANKKRVDGGKGGWQRLKELAGVGRQEKGSQKLKRHP